MKKGITIIIPVYNGAGHIKRCIKSILSQEYTDCQIIIVDDGSSDNTLHICREMVGTNPCFMILHQENQGVSAARNRGIMSADREWIYFLDADDELDENALKIMKESMDISCQWIIMNYRKQIDGSNDIAASEIWVTERTYFYGKKGFAELLNSGLFKYPCGKLYRTEIIQQNKVQFPLKVVYGEDIRFNLQYFCYVEKYSVQPASAFIYHIRQGEGAGSSYYENSYEMQMDIDREILDMLQNRYGLGDETIRKINPYFYKQGINTAAAYLTIWKQLPFSRRRQEIKKIMKDSRFKSFLGNEWNSRRIHRLDYFLLKQGHFLIYYFIHYLYAGLKTLKKREEGL